jgi:Tfp pilus assembly protein PilF
MTRLTMTLASFVLTASTATAQSFTAERRDDARAASVAAATFNVPLTTEEHMALARRAQESGDYATARRAYKIAALLEREDGRVPAAAVVGLVNVLNAQGALAEAIAELEHLASDAVKASDYDTEARALADAVWLKVETRDRAPLRNDARRLRALLATNSLSPETRRYVTLRVR